MLFVCSDNIDYNGIIALYFYASWMPFQLKMQKMISKIELKYNDIKFLAIDISQLKSLCKLHGVDEVPTIILLYNGQSYGRFSGVIMESAFKSFFSKRIERIRKQQIKVEK